MLVVLQLSCSNTIGLVDHHYPSVDTTGGIVVSKTSGEKPEIDKAAKGR
jgi:hypothetical protein